MKNEMPVEPRGVLDSSPSGIEGLTVLIPAYNEKDAVGPVLENVCRVMRELEFPYEVLLVDDGSQDETAAVAERCEGITVLRHLKNRGYGAALKTGLRHSSYELICIADADGSYPIGRVGDLVKRLVERRLDMVVGARVGKKVAIPLIRRPAKKLIGWLAAFVAGQGIPDLNSGLRVFKRSAARRMLGMLPDGFSFTTTITLGMLTNGYLVDYMPIEYHHRIGRSKIRPLRDTMNFIQLVLRIALYFAPLRIFLPISAFLFLLAIAWAVVSKYVFQQLADISTLVLAMGSLQVAMTGMLAELINRRFPNFYREE
jgi:glycosyltransferase involved in cell wall biosynthesis